MNCTPMFPCTIDEQIAEVERELQIRREVYPRLVEAHKMGQGRADLQERRMYAVLATLREVKAAQCARK